MMSWFYALKEKFFGSKKYKQELEGLEGKPITRGIVEKLYDGTFGPLPKELPENFEKRLKKAVVLDIFHIVKNSLVGKKKDFILEPTHQFAMDVAFSNLVLIHYNEKLKEEGYQLDTNDVCLRLVEKLVKLAPEQNPAKYYVEGQQMLKLILEHIHDDKVGGYILGIKEVTQSYLLNLRERDPEVKKQCLDLFTTLLFSMHKLNLTSGN